MKALKTISTIALAALVIAGCQKKELEFTPSSPIKVGEKITITASSEAQSTKTVLQSDNSIYWSPADQITVLYGDETSYSKGTFVSQNTAAAATAEFSGTLSTVLGSSEGAAAPSKYLYGVFPSYDNASLSAQNGDVLLEVPFNTDQTAVEGSFDPTAVTAVARSSSLNLSFYNVVSVLALTVEEDDVLGIQVENIDKSLDGIGAESMYVYWSPSSSEPIIWGRNNQTHTVSLNPPAGQDTFTKGNTYYMAVLPGTYSAGVKFTLYKAGGNVELTINSPVTAERSKIHNVTLKQKQLTIERLWGKFPTEWPGFTSNLDRCATTDGEYVYVAKAGASAKGVWAISIADPTQVKEVCMDGVETEGTFPTSCVRTIYDPATSKYILLLSNMSMTGGEHLYLYAYTNGIDAEPVKLLSGYTLPTWADRRFGDFFTVCGDWSKGCVWFRTNGAYSTTARFNIVNGALTSQTPDGFNYGYGASQGKGSFYQYDMDAKYGFLVTDSIGMFYDLNSAEGQAWNAPSTDANMRRMFGVTPFEFNGQKYIAYTKMKDDNAARSWLRIIKDKGTSAEFKASLEENDIVYEAAIQIDELGPSTNVMAGATYSDQTSASCAVAYGPDCVYIIGHHHNVGLSVFKMSMK